MGSGQAKRKRAGPKPGDGRSKIYHVPDNEIARVIRSKSTLSAAAKHFGICPATLQIHCTKRLGPESQSYQAYKQKAYTNECKQKRLERIGVDDEDRFDFPVSMTPEERDHIANMDHPVRFQPKKKIKRS